MSSPTSTPPRRKETIGSLHQPSAPAQPEAWPTAQPQPLEPRPWGVPRQARPHGQANTPGMAAAPGLGGTGTRPAASLSDSELGEIINQHLGRPPGLRGSLDQWRSLRGTTPSAQHLAPFYRQDGFFDSKPQELLMPSHIPDGAFDSKLLAQPLSSAQGVQGMQQQQQQPQSAVPPGPGPRPALDVEGSRRLLANVDKIRAKRTLNPREQADYDQAQRVMAEGNDPRPPDGQAPSTDVSSQQGAGRWPVFGPGIMQSVHEAQAAPATGNPPKAAPVGNTSASADQAMSGPGGDASQVGPEGRSAGKGAGDATAGLAEVEFYGRYKPDDKAEPYLIGAAKDMLKDKRTPPGARPVLIKLPSGEASKFLVPKDYNPQAVYDAGHEHARGDTAALALKIYQSVAFYGTFDLQRNSGKGRVESGPNTFYPAYTAASNYNVGLYLGGAGRSWEDTERLAKLFALSFSSNAGESDQVEMWKAGWLASQKMSPTNPPAPPAPPPPRQIPIIPYGRSPGAPPPPVRVK